MSDKNKIRILEDMILKAKDKYYSTLEDDYTELNIIDAEYDRLEEELRKLDPKNKLLNAVGSEKEINNKKVIHEIPMLSMDKRNNKNDVKDWFESFKYNNIIDDCEIIIEPKIDGVSGDLYYKNGKFIVASTRGNGKIGNEIKANFLDCIPETIPLFNNEKDFHIRGEFYISKKYNEDKSYDEMVPLRNQCAGILNRKEKTDIHKYINFIAYQIVLEDNKYKESEKIDYLSTIKHEKFSAVPYVLSDNINTILGFYDDYNKSIRDSWSFETDGIVLIFNNYLTQNKINKELGSTDHHNKYSIAFKPPPKGEWTYLTDVEWNTSKNGRVIPTGILKPVKIGEAIITRASLNNKSFIEVFNIQINDRVYVVRSNDVIPKIIKSERTDNKKKIKIDFCPSCGNKLYVKGVDYICENYLKCPSQIINRFLQWFEKNDIKNIGESGINNLVSVGHFTNIWEIYSMDINDLKKVISKFIGISPETDSMKEFIESFEKSRYQTVQNIIGKYGIPNIGIKSLQKLNIKDLNDLIKYKNINYMYSDSAMEKNLCIWLNEENNFDNLFSLVKYMRPILETNNDNKIKFCITGNDPNKRRKTIINELESTGKYIFVPTVNRETDLLILCGNNKSSIHNKQIQAMKYGTKIVKYDEFIK